MRQKKKKKIKFVEIYLWNLFKCWVFLDQIKNYIEKKIVEKTTKNCEISKKGIKRKKLQC